MAFGGLSNPRFCVLLSPALTLAHKLLARGQKGLDLLQNGLFGFEAAQAVFKSQDILGNLAAVDRVVFVARGMKGALHIQRRVHRHPPASGGQKVGQSFPIHPRGFHADFRVGFPNPSGFQPGYHLRHPGRRVGEVLVGQLHRFRAFQHYDDPR